MSKIIAAGDAAVVVSSIKLEDLRKVAKYRPDALTLKDEDGNAYFAVCVGKKPEIGKFGVVYNAEMNDGSGIACLTVDISDRNPAVDVKTYLADLLGGTLANINAVETGVAATLSEIDAEIASVKDSIEILA